jgi:transposase
MKIIELTGLSWGAVKNAKNLYEEGGMSALKPKTRGRKNGMGRTLNIEQEKRIQQLICETRPEQLKMDFALWTRAAVKELIRCEFGLDFPIRTIGDYLHRWGFTPKKPIKRAYEQQPKAVRKWLDEEYPEIERRSVSEGAEIHWGDETCVMNTDVRGRSYSPPRPNSGNPRCMGATGEVLYDLNGYQSRKVPLDDDRWGFQLWPVY